MDLASSQADWRKLDHAEITRHRDPGMARTGGNAPNNKYHAPETAQPIQAVKSPPG
jgi:hypothetical protein